MQEELISYKTAVLAKEKGFNIYCRNYYDEDTEGLYENEDYPYNSYNDSLFAPTQSLLQKWLREIHNIEVEVYTFISSSIKKVIYRGQIVKHNTKEISKVYSLCEESKEVNKLSPPIDFNIYEEALEKGLYEALKLIS